MKQKIFILMLMLGSVFQALAEEKSYWEEEWENIIELFQILIPLGLVVGAPLIIALIIIVPIKLIGYFFRITGDLAGEIFRGNRPEEPE